MRKLYKLKKDYSIIVQSEIIEYPNPDYIYLPIYENFNVLVKQNEKICKGQVVIENNLNKVLSPVSGSVLGVKIMSADGKNTNVLVIKNDFEEKEKKKREFKTIKYSKEEIVSLLYEFYFNKLASDLETRKIKNLVINGIEDEPYIYNKSFLLKNYEKEILEITDLIASQFKINNSMIAIKSNDSKCIESYLNKIGTYPNISLSLVPDYYLLGKEPFLLEHLGLNDKETLIIDVEVLFDIYEALFLQRNNYKTLITISGPTLSKSVVIRLTKGTLLEDAIINNIKVKDLDPVYVLNGPMTGKKCDIKREVITENTKGVYIAIDENIKEEKCLNCGLCLRVCPVKINPKKCLDKKRKSAKCLDCGLCSYICPSNINLRKVLKGENE